MLHGMPDSRLGFQFPQDVSEKPSQRLSVGLRAAMASRVAMPITLQGGAGARLVCWPPWPTDTETLVQLFPWGVTGASPWSTRGGHWPGHPVSHLRQGPEHTHLPEWQRQGASRSRAGPRTPSRVCVQNEARPPLPMGPGRAPRVSGHEARTEAPSPGPRRLASRRHV